VKHWCRLGRGVQAEPAPDPVDQQQRGDLFHLFLHRHETDQLAVQGGEHLVDAGCAALVGQSDRGLEVQQFATPLGASPSSAAARQFRLLGDAGDQVADPGEQRGTRRAAR